MNCCSGNKHGEKQTRAPKSSDALKWLVVAVFAVGGIYYLWTQHQAHVFQYWPIAIFLLCPLMHLFGGHGKHGAAHKGHSSESLDPLAEKKD